MEFDVKRVYTAVNADELKVGSIVIVANYIELLKHQVEANSFPTYTKKLTCIMGTSSINRFKADDNKVYNLAYLVSEPKEKKLKWTDLKIGDVLKHKKEPVQRLVTAIDSRTDEEYHILAGDLWCDDERLADWEKVQE